MTRRWAAFAAQARELGHGKEAEPRFQQELDVGGKASRVDLEQAQVLPHPGGGHAVVAQDD